MAPVDDPLGLIGSIVEKYEILEVAGEGGFSTVYKAEHLIWRQPVAIKFFSILQGAKPEVREKMLDDFLLEGRLMSELSSKSAAIVQARDIGKLDLPDGDWIPYMVLEWLDGTSLDRVLKNEAALGLAPRGIGEAVRLLEPAAVALDVAHQRGVAHRDLKPANIIIIGDPRVTGVPVKVLDFGIAKVMGEHVQLQEQLQLTGQQITAFTPNYGAPEQFSRSYGATGPWTDVYAMALILVELLRGDHKALEGETFFELGVASCDPDKRPTPRHHGIDVSDEVEAVFGRALALQPRDRFATMGAFWSALYRVALPGAPTWQPVITGSGISGSHPAIELGGRPSSSRSHAIVGQAGVSGNDPTLAHTGSLPPLPTKRRGPLLAGAAMAAALVGASIYWLGPGRADGGSLSTTAAAPTVQTTAAAAAPPLAAPSADPAASVRAAPSGAPTGEASAAQPSTSASSTPPPRPIQPPAPGPRPQPASPPKPQTDAGTDAWDPSNFGGRR